MLFSKRNKITPFKKDLQVESIDDELRIRLWNSLKIFFGDNFNGYAGRSSIKESNYELYLTRLWHNYFKYSLDDLPYNYYDALKIIKQFFFTASWYEIYDFIEFTLKFPPDINSLNKFPNYCNVLLEEENSAYRIIDGKFTRITDNIEIEEIEEVIKKSDKYSGVKEHLETALMYMSNRKNPDYRNSIKESISAVESICQIITDDKKATLGTALKKIEEMFKIHPALKSAFSSLYGYTSDKDGIRHSLLEKSNLTFDDAKYMLVTCSAFINYLLGILSKKED